MQGQRRQDFTIEERIHQCDEVLHRCRLLHLDPLQVLTEAVQRAASQRRPASGAEPTPRRPGVTAPADAIAQPALPPGTMPQPIGPEPRL